MVSRPLGKREQNCDPLKRFDFSMICLIKSQRLLNMNRIKYKNISLIDLHLPGLRKMVHSLGFMNIADGECRDRRNSIGTRTMETKTEE